jgi:hypothetical protein
MLEKIIPVLLAPMQDDNKWVYGQRDMVPHHLKLQAYIDHEEKDPAKKRKYKTYVFDFCKAGWGNIAKDRTKLLLSPLVGLSYGEIEDYIMNFAVPHEQGIRDNFNPSSEERKIGNIVEERRKIILSPKNEMEVFDRLALYEDIKNAGRPAKNVIHYLKRYNDFIGMQPVTLEAKYLDLHDAKIKIPVSDILPEPSISNKPYSAEKSIPKSEKSLKERLEAMMSKKTKYELNPVVMDAVTGIYDIFKKYL